MSQSLKIKEKSWLEEKLLSNIDFAKKDRDRSHYYFKNALIRYFMKT